MKAQQTGFDDDWVAVYVDYNGGRTKYEGNDDSDVKSRFQILQSDLQTELLNLLQELGASKTKDLTAILQVIFM